MSDERRRTFLRKAYELARSGHFEGEQALEAALQKDYPESQRVAEQSLYPRLLATTLRPRSC
jgi:hypothetical protein